MKKTLCLMLMLILLLSTSLAVTAEEAKNVTYAFVATWQETTPWLPDHGDGIDVFRVSEDGTLDFVFNFPTETNSTILTISADGQYVYATDETRDYDGNEGAGGGAISMVFDPASGTLTRLNKVPSFGAATSNVDVNAVGTLVAVSNHGSTVGEYYAVKARQGENGEWEVYKEYDDSSICVYPVEEDGSLNSKQVSLCIVPVNGAHLHTVRFSPSNQYLLSCDKGTGKIFVFQVNNDEKTVAPAQVPYFEDAGTHPRHLAFSPDAPDRFYVIHEIGLQIGSYQLNEETGEITKLDLVPSCGGEKVCLDGFGAGSDIRVHNNGKYIYVSNRRAKGDEFEGNIGVFSVDEAGKLTLIQCIGVGPNPRGFNLDPSSQYLYVCESNNDTITRFLVDPETGLLSDPVTACSVGTPTCIMFHTYLVD